MLLLWAGNIFHNFSKNSFRNTIRVSNGLDPDCLQRLSADNRSPRASYDLENRLLNIWI